MGKVTSVSTQKGGPGKTTVTRNLGEGVSEADIKVLLIDNDPQGNLTKSFFGDELPEEIMTLSSSVTSSSQKVMPGVSNTYFLYEENEMPEPYRITDNLYIIGATKHLAEMFTKDPDCIYEFKEKLELLAKEFQHIFIDCPPSAGLLQTAAHAASDYLLIPTELNEDSIDGVHEQLASASSNRKRLNKNLSVLGILINGKDSHRILIENEYHEQLKEKYNGKLFETVITSSVKVSEARSFNKTVVQHAPRSPQAKQFTALREEYLERAGV